ncbi:hypothetical protein ACWEKM_09785 [Streptomyces sp. NPDC004752]
MTNLTAYLAALVFLAFAVHRLAITRGGRADPAQRNVAGFALCAGTAMLLNSPAVLDTLEGFVPSPDAELLITYELKAAAAMFLALVALALDPQGSRPVVVRRRTRAAVAVQLAALGLFLAADATDAGTSALAAPGRGWALAAYNALFAGYLCWCLYVTARALIRRARRTPPGSLRMGLRVSTPATVTAVVWSLWALDDVAANIAWQGPHHGPGHALKVGGQ